MGPSIAMGHRILMSLPPPHHHVTLCHRNLIDSTISAWLGWNSLGIICEWEYSGSQIYIPSGFLIREHFLLWMTPGILPFARSDYLSLYFREWSLGPFGSPLWGECRYFDMTFTAVSIEVPSEMSAVTSVSLDARRWCGQYAFSDAPNHAILLEKEATELSMNAFLVLL